MSSSEPEQPLWSVHQEKLQLHATSSSTFPRIVLGEHSSSTKQLPMSALQAPEIPEIPSLELLKSLDDLPDISSQLQTAHALCNHSARAEMVLRWLTGKLKTTRDIRVCADSWNIMASCVRLLPAQKIAALLGSAFLDILQLTVVEVDLPLDTIASITRLWELMTKLGKSGAAAVLAMLAVNSGKAAAIAGPWFQHVYKLSNAKIIKASQVVEDRLLSPALHIWTSRKPESSDSEAFNTHCLAPATLLLTVLCTASEPRLGKRKRDSSTPILSENYVHSLESLVAKHTILPARAAFIKKQPGHGRQPKRNGDVTTEGSLEEALAPVKLAVSSDDTLTLVPLILDITLRTIPTPSPRERYRERPWIEAVFLTLKGCCVANERKAINATTVDLLHVLEQRGIALSPATLADLVRHDVVPAEGPPEIVDWLLLAAVTKLDASVFVDATLVKAIFHAMSNEEQNGEQSLSDLWRVQILLPIARSYAQGRRLQMFVSLWHEQLQGLRDERVSSVWLDFIADMASLTVDAATDADVASILETYSGSLTQGVHDQDRATLQSDFAVLEALIKGLRSDDKISKAQEKLEEIRSELLRIDATAVGGASSFFRIRSYAVLEEVMNVWFPSWAIQQPQDTIPDLGVSIFKSALLKSALGQCGRPDVSARAAQNLMAAVCVKFCDYQDHQKCAKQCQSAVDRFVNVPNAGIMALLKYPALWQTLTTDQVCALARLLLTSDEATLGLARAALCETRLPAQDIIGKVLLAALQELRADGTSVPATAEDRLVYALRALDVASLTGTQGSEILNGLIKLPAPSQVDHNPARLQQRLSLIFELCKHTPASALFANDPESLWSLINLLQTKTSAKKCRKPGINQSASWETVRLLEEIINLVSRKWASEKQSAGFTAASKQMLEHVGLLKDIVSAQRPSDGSESVSGGTSGQQTEFSNEGQIAAALKPLFDASQDITLQVVRNQQDAIKAISKENFTGETVAMTLHDVYHGILRMSSDGPSIHIRRLALETLEMILKTKPFMVNQFAVEQTISILHKILQTESQVDAIYLQVCRVFNAILGQYRSRLQGRFHLVVALLQQLITSLFQASPASAQSPLLRRQASALGRLLEFFCNPPHVRKSGKASELVDEARRAQVQAGQYVQYVLHHYCAQQLVSTPAEGVKESMASGIWAAISAIEANNADGIKVLSAAMNNSERAILRSVYDQWKSSGKWENS